jgi:molybdenum cofactor sulfurtransferase
LTKFPADFVTLSFYKIFGYPTGLGALIIRNGTKNKNSPLTSPDNASILKKTYFGGGTVAATLSDEHFSVPREGISERFEDGTISFLNITSLKYGFQAIQKFGISNIEKYVKKILAGKFIL